MSDIPQKLGHYVVDIFNEKKEEMKVRGGVIKVDEEAIHKLLGIPNDGLKLDTVNPTKNLAPRMLEWKDLYDTDYIPRKSIFWG
jgi:hypothetical protein